MVRRETSVRENGTVAKVCRCVRARVAGVTTVSRKMCGAGQCGVSVELGNQVVNGSTRISKV